MLKYGNEKTRRLASFIVGVVLLALVAPGISATAGEDKAAVSLGERVVSLVQSLVAKVTTFLPASGGDGRVVNPELGSQTGVGDTGFILNPDPFGDAKPAPK